MRAANRQKFILIMTLVAVAIFAFHFTSQTIFGVIGYTPHEKAGVLVVAVFALLVVMSLAQTIAIFSPPKSRLLVISSICSGTLACGWLGLSVGNAIFKIENPPLILAATLASAVIGAIVGKYRQHHREIEIVLITIVAVATYGLAFLCSSVAFALLSTEDRWWGLLWAGLCLLAIAKIGLFLNSMFVSIEIIHSRWRSINRDLPTVDRYRG